jgi:D-lactate dehydrogenase
MKITFFETKQWEQEIFRKKLKKHWCNFYEETLALTHLPKIKKSEALVVFINSKVDKQVIDSMPKLKLIITMSTGYDHIDCAYAKSKNITVCNVPYYGENTVAEHTMALILSLSRNIHKAYVRTTQGNFGIDGLEGFDLKGKTIGILGGGHIGMHVARIAKGFDMNVLVYDLFKDNFKAEIIGFKYETVDNILKQSDIISLHIPYTKETHHLIDKKKFEKMKKGVLLINTARGGLIDTSALIWAMEKGIVAGAGLDVIEDEEIIREEKELLHDPKFQEKSKRLIQNHVLLRMENVVYTPHIAFYSREALIRILDTTIDDINGFENQKMLNVVNK